MPRLLLNAEGGGDWPEGCAPPLRTSCAGRASRSTGVGTQVAIGCYDVHGAAADGGGAGIGVGLRPESACFVPATVNDWPAPVPVPMHSKIIVNRCRHIDRGGAVAGGPRCHSEPRKIKCVYGKRDRVAARKSEALVKGQRPSRTGARNGKCVSGGRARDRFADRSLRWPKRCRRGRTAHREGVAAVQGDRTSLKQERPAAERDQGIAAQDNRIGQGHGIGGVVYLELAAVIERDLPKADVCLAIAKRRRVGADGQCAAAVDRKGAERTDRGGGRVVVKDKGPAVDDGGQAIGGGSSRGDAPP